MAKEEEAGAGSRQLDQREKSKASGTHFFL